MGLPRSSYSSAAYSSAGGTVTAADYFDETLALSSSMLVVGSARTRKVWVFKADGSGVIPTTPTSTMDASTWPYSGSTYFAGFGGFLALTNSYLAVRDDDEIFVYDTAGSLADPFAALASTAYNIPAQEYSCASAQEEALGIRHGCYWFTGSNDKLSGAVAASNDQIIISTGDGTYSSRRRYFFDPYAGPGGRFSGDDYRTVHIFKSNA